MNRNSLMRSRAAVAANLAVHAAVIGGAFAYRGVAGAVVAGGALLASSVIAKGVNAKPAFAAPGTWKMYYHIDIKKPGGAELFGQGYKDSEFDITKPNKAHVTSLSAALGIAAAWVRRYQSSGVNALGTVFGKPLGADATTPAKALEGSAQAEQEYAKIDIPSLGLMERISLANRDATGNGYELDNNITSDVSGDSAGSPPAGEQPTDEGDGNTNVPGG